MNAAGTVARAGTELYYEAWGAGPPVLLVHGAFASGDAFVPLTPRLAASHRVIRVDLQGHGRTADRDSPLSYETLADDCAAVLDHLGVIRCAVVGYSLGGGTALQLAFRRPDLVSRLVVVSAPFQHRGWRPDVLAAFRTFAADRAGEFAGTRMLADHEALAPRPEDFPFLLDKLGDLLGRHEYDWSAQVAALRAPTLVVLGDRDSLPPGHGAELYELLGGGRVVAVGGRDVAEGGPDVAEGAMAGRTEGEAGPTSRLAVLPGVTHYDILRSPLLAECVTAFLGSR